MIQWHSQNRVVAREKGRATYTVLRNVQKVSVWKHALLGGSGGMPPQEFRTSKIASAGFSGQVSVAKIIHISGSALVADQPLPSFDRVLILSCAVLI